MKGYIKKLLREGLINESATPILYHFTRLIKLENILKSNELMLTTNVGTPADANKTNKYYYVSFSTSKSIGHGYGTQFTTESSVRIKFDGTKLNNNYKFQPIDYWQNPRTPDLMKNNKNNDEMEDRLISNKNSVPNINKYIISIDIFANKITDTLYNLIKNSGIKVNFYGNAKDFGVGDESRVITPEIVKDERESRESRGYNSDYGSLISLITYRNDKINQESILNRLKNEYGIDEDRLEIIRNEINKFDDKIAYYFKPYYSDVHMRDISISLSNMIHNNKSNSDKVIRYLIQLLVNDYKQYNPKSFFDYINKKMNKGKISNESINIELNKGVNNLIKVKFKELISDNSYGAYLNSGDYIDNIMEYGPVKTFLENKVKEISKYVSNYILNNNNMYKDYYLISSSELKHLFVNNDDYGKALGELNTEDVDSRSISNIIYHLINEIDDFVYDEVTNYKEEYNKQW